MLMIFSIDFIVPVHGTVKLENRNWKFDKLVKSQALSVLVIPAKAGIQGNQSLLDSRFRGSDGFGDFLRDHQIWPLCFCAVDERIQFWADLPSF